MKKVVVLIRSNPVTTVKVSEGLRVALGLTLSENQITVLYMDEGARATRELQPVQVGQDNLAHSLELFEACNIRQVVDEESLKTYRVEKVREDVQSITRGEALELLNQAQEVIPF